jgi:dihydropteroate synthase
LDLPVAERLEGSLATAVIAVMKGARILRVHDVQETYRAIRIASEILKVQNGK